MDKFFLKSRTVIAILLTAFVALAPELGISFSEDDSALVSDVVDAIIQAVTLAAALVGRFLADRPLTVRPGGDS